MSFVVHPLTTFARLGSTSLLQFTIQSFILTWGCTVDSSAGAV